MRKILLTVITILLLCQNSYGQAAGALDLSFNNGLGYIEKSINTGIDKATGVLMQPDGKILVSGFTNNSTTGKDFLLLRIQANGNMDSTFGTNGIITVDVGVGSDDEASSLALQTDGKIILAGNTDNGIVKEGAIMRFLVNGNTDSTFGIYGTAIFDFDSNRADVVNTVKIHTVTGNIVVGGYSQINSSKSKPAVARFNNAGTLDTTFNSTGKRTLWVTSLDYQYFFSLEDLEVLPNGKICAVGWRDFPAQSWSKNVWGCRINSNGTMDNTFNTTGLFGYNGGFNGDDFGYSLVLDASNNYVYSGGSDVSTLYSDLIIKSVTNVGANGTISNSYKETPLGDDIGYAIGINSAGEYLVGGSVGNSTARSFVISKHNNTNGALVNGFGTLGKTITTFNGNSMNECLDITIQADDKIIAVGYSGNNLIIARYLNTINPLLDSFQLQSPANNALNITAPSSNLTWTAAFGSTSYEIQIDINNTFANPVIVGTSTTNLFTTNVLALNTNYFWRVRAVAGANYGNWTAPWQFKTVELAPPVLALPINLSNNVDPATLNLDWNDVINAISYEVQLSQSINFTNPITVTAVPSNVSYTSLAYNKTYYWRARASNGNNFSFWSAPWQFNTQMFPTGINNLKKGVITIFPNPAATEITIKTGLVLFTKIKVISLEGKILLQKNISLTNNYNLNLETLASGNYFIIIDDTYLMDFIKLK